jgi:branched-chain amino acid aminotransferase
MFEPSDLAWHNGKLVDREAAAPSIASHSLHLGIGVFDGMMAYWNGDHHLVFRQAAHLSRFRAGAARMGLEVRWSETELAAGIAALLERQSGVTVYVRPIAYRGGPQINITGSAAMPVDVAIFTVVAPRNTQRSLRCRISPYQRISAQAIPVHWKICGSYVNSYLARREAEGAGYDEAILLDRNGLIAEASAANIFFLAGSKLVTPAVTHDIFPGITRQVILEWANSCGVETEEVAIRPDTLAAFDGAFLCSTLMEIAPITSIDDVSYATPDQLPYRDLLRWFRNQALA